MHPACPRILSVALLLTALSTSPASAVTPEISAELRARTEVDRHRGWPATGVNDDTLSTRSYLRTRIDLNLPMDSLTRIYVQIQDSRIYGSEPGISGGLANDMNLGLHQAFVELRHWLWHRLEAAVGRQELAYGNQRLIGPVGWNNVGRAFDGARASLAFNKVTLEGVAATTVERDDPSGKQGSDADQMLGIFAVTWPKSTVELMAAFELDSRRPDSSDLKARALERGTLAAYSARTFASNFDYIANLAVQGGTVNAGNGDRDIEAYLVALELGATVPGRAKARFALGIDHASGDDGQDSTKVKEFNNLYYTGHKFRGYMDNFIAPATTPTGALAATSGRGLTDLYGRAAFNFARHWRAGIDLHLFGTSQQYTSLKDGSDTRTIGSELDAWVKLSEYKGIAWEYGASLFFVSEDFVGAGRETTQFWGYSQLQVNVK